MKTIKSIIALSFMALLLCSEAAFAGQVWVLRCQHCGKVAKDDWEKMTAGSCTHFFHDWRLVELNPSDYKKQMKKQKEETDRKKQQEFQQWHYGHMQGWW